MARIASALLTVAAVVALAACSSATTGQAAPSSTPAATTTSVTSSTPSTFSASPSQVDALVAADGHPLDLAAEMAPGYPDAYAMINDDCETMSSGTTAPQQWLAAHLLNASVPGEAEALRIGVPLVCPQFNVTVLSVEQGTS